MGANGLAMNIHTSLIKVLAYTLIIRPFETFVVLEGEITFRIGEPNLEKEVTLGKWDTFSCPPGVYRGFVNASSEERAVLLTAINGDPKERDDVNVPRAITEQLHSEFGEEVVEEFRKVVNLP